MKKIYKKVMFGAAVIAACLTFAFASCNPATGGGTPDNDQPPNPTPTPTPTVTPTATPTPTPIPVPSPSSQDLSIKFGITTSGTTTVQDVTGTFNVVHAYLATNPAVDEATRTTASATMPAGLATKIGDIALGDYIDLVSLSIAAYPAGRGELNNLTNNDQLRLIVVGINSFREGPDKDHTGSYADNGSPAAPHLVFQFQNIPVNHRMNDTLTNAGGYAASDMRKYLVDVGGSGGNFLAGLINAGVPDSVLWEPKRYVVTGGNQVGVSAGLIEDKLWLPTEREMFGSRTNSNGTHETETNQARLAYYADAASRVKSGSAYWLASPVSASASYFCSVGNIGNTNYSTASSTVGVAPAFCVR